MDVLGFQSGVRNFRGGAGCRRGMFSGAEIVEVAERAVTLLTFQWVCAQVTPLARGGGGRTTTVNLNFYGDVLTNEDFDERINTARNEFKRRGN